MASSNQHAATVRSSRAPAWINREGDWRMPVGPDLSPEPTHTPLSCHLFSSPSPCLLGGRGMVDTALSPLDQVWLLESMLLLLLLYKLAGYLACCLFTPGITANVVGKLYDKNDDMVCSCQLSHCFKASCTPDSSTKYLGK